MPDLHAETDLPRVRAARAAGRRAGSQAERLQELRRKQRFRLLKADRVGVGDVVTRDVDRRFAGLQTGDGRIENGRQTHDWPLWLIVNSRRS